MPTNAVRTAFIASIQRRSAVEASFIDQAMRLRARYGRQQQLRRLMFIIASCMLASIFYTFFRLHWTIPVNNDLPATGTWPQSGIAESGGIGHRRSNGARHNEYENVGGENDEDEDYEEDYDDHNGEKNDEVIEKEETDQHDEVIEDEETDQQAIRRTKRNSRNSKKELTDEVLENEEEVEDEEEEEEEEDGEEFEKEDEKENEEEDEEEEEGKDAEKDGNEYEDENGDEDEDENERKDGEKRKEDEEEDEEQDGVDADADDANEGAIDKTIRRRNPKLEGLANKRARINEQKGDEYEGYGEEYEAEDKDKYEKEKIAVANNIKPKSADELVRSTGPSKESSILLALPSSTLYSQPKQLENYNDESTLWCDSECELFRRSLATWPTGKPKAVIYYLIYRAALKSLSRSISSVNRHFRRQFAYPIIVFIEPDLDNDVDRKRIHDMAGSESMPLYIQVVHFQIPPYVNATAVPKLAGFGRRKRTIGYRHMCRFHAGGVYQQPIMRSEGLEFGWRLDDDSMISAAISYDVFQFMSIHKIQYGYRKINRGWSPVDYQLWDAVDRYVNASRTPMRTPFYDEWPKNAARYFNNFEISSLSVWLSQPYRDYFRFVDRLGGIYYYKWGDAAIKTIAVTLFIPKEKTYEFKEVKYAHMRIKNK